MIKMTEAYLYGHWASDKKIKLRGTSYRVGKMSYGDYFLEPGQPLGETKPFNAGTLWPEKRKAKDGVIEYVV